MTWSREHALSIVVPVYRGADTLDALVAELAPLTTVFATPQGRAARVTEVLLVHDCGPDDSDVVIRRLAADPRLGAPGVAEQQLRAARRDPGRHGVLGR